MRRISGVTGVAALGIVALLGGCESLGNAGARVTDSVANTGAAIGAPWGSMRPSMPEDSATVQRLRGAGPVTASLRMEEGNVWPAQEGPRATLANPDAALRGIPAYRPGELDRMSAPAPRSTWQPTDPPAPRGLPPGLEGSSSLPPGPLRQPASTAPVGAPPVPQTAPLPPRADGQVIQTPRGPVTTTGGNDRIQTFTVPGGGTGTVVRDGNTATVIGPGGQVQTVTVPR
jgi:hypothetical protein